jgi:hypothetical protein
LIHFFDKKSFKTCRKFVIFRRFSIEKEKGGILLFEMDLTYPIILQQFEALKGRTLENHHIMPEVEEKIRILNAGYQGEVTLNYHLGLMPNKKYLFSMVSGSRLESHFSNRCTINFLKIYLNP